MPIHRMVWISSSIFFLLRSQKSELKFINQPVNSVGFPFKVEIDGASVGEPSQ